MGYKARSLFLQDAVTFKNMTNLDEREELKDRTWGHSCICDCKGERIFVYY